MKGRHVIPIAKKQVLRDLDAFVDTCKTATVAAKKLGVTASVLSQTRNDKYPVIPARILRKLGYKTEVIYTPVGGPAKRPAAVVPQRVEVIPHDYPPLIGTLPVASAHRPAMVDPGPPVPEVFIDVTAKD